MTGGKDGRTCDQSRMHLIDVTSTMHEAPELASPADALRVALMMLARPGRLEMDDVLEMMARTEQRWGRREKVHEPHAPTLLAVRRNVSSCRRMRPRDAQR